MQGEKDTVKDSIHSSQDIGELGVEITESQGSKKSEPREFLPSLKASALEGLNGIKGLAHTLNIVQRAKSDAGEKDIEENNNFADSKYNLNSSLRNLSLSLSMSITQAERVEKKLKNVEAVFLTKGKYEGGNVEINAVKLSEALYSNFPHLKPKKPKHIKEKFIIPNYVIDIAKSEGYFISNFYNLIELEIISPSNLLSKKDTAGIIPEYIKQVLADNNAIDPNAVTLFSSKFLHEVLQIYQDEKLKTSMKDENNKRLGKLKKFVHNKINSKNIDISSRFIAKILINTIKTYIANNKLEHSSLSCSSSASETQLLNLLGTSSDEAFSILKIFRDSNIVLMVDNKLIEQTFALIHEDFSFVENEKSSMKFLMINTQEGTYKEEGFECMMSKARLEYLKSVKVFEFFKALGLSGKQILTAPLQMLKLLESQLHILLKDESIDKNEILNQFFNSANSATNRMSEITVVAKVLEDLLSANNIKAEVLKEAMSDFNTPQQILEEVKKVFDGVIERYPELEYHVEVKYGYIAAKDRCLQSSSDLIQYSEGKRMGDNQLQIENEKEEEPQSKDKPVLSAEVKELMKKYPKHFKYLIHSGIVNTDLLLKLDNIEFSALLSTLGREWVKCVVHSGDFSYFLRLKQSKKVSFLEGMLHYLGNHAEDIKISQFITQEVPKKFEQRSPRRQVLEALVCGDLIKLDMLVTKNRFGLHCLMKAVSVKRAGHFLDFVNSPMIQNYLNHLSVVGRDDFKYSIFEHNTQYLVFLREVLIYANDHAKDHVARHNYTRLNTFIAECIHRWSTLYQPFDNKTVAQHIIVPFDKLFLPEYAMLYYGRDCVTTDMIETREKLKGSEEEQDSLRAMHMSAFLEELVKASSDQVERENQGVGYYL